MSEIDINIKQLTLEKTIQFYSFSSAIDISFWHQVAKYQLEVKKLDQGLIPIHGYYSLNIQSIPSGNSVFPMLMGINDKGLNPWDTIEPAKNQVKIPGWLHLCGTKEEFSKIDKKQFLKEMGDKIQLSMETHQVLEHPQLFNLITCLCFSNLKTHRFQYWFNFPAALPKTPYTQRSVTNAQEFFGTNVQKIQSQIQNIDLNLASQGIFWLKISKNEQTDESNYELLPLSSWNQFTSNEREQIILAYLDPCSFSQTLAWSLRNVLFYFKNYHNLKCLKLFCIKQFVGEYKFNLSLSTIIETDLGNESDITNQNISWTGWERDSEQKLKSRLIDLSAMMDPIRLAETSVDLNLKLMKWRLVPNLDLEKHNNLKCLLLGAGTLGCQVARTLLGYGVKHITFVDNGKVSYSNPVRQSLFEFEDCLNGGKPKAKCASEKLRKIYPKVVSEGYQLTIPMAGHPIAEQERELTQNNILKLTELIEKHDMVYLLTDSRESRWLPTLLCSHFNKPLINAALGFDSYVVMRHGSTIPGENTKNLGCYFCTDVVAPTDSLSERTLDQQCTVTRPGLASIVGALAVELSISMLHHPQGALAKPLNNNTDESDSQPQSELGNVPHQIRGFLNSFQTMILEGPAYSQCIACSSKVVEAYRANRIEFLFNIFEKPEYLTHLTGLDDLLDNDLVGMTEWNSEDDEDDF